MARAGRFLILGAAVLTIGGALAVAHLRAADVKVADPTSVVMIVNRDSNEIAFMDIKTKKIVDQYERAFSRRPGLRPRHLLEIGMWDGGSLAFWNEILNPEKIVGVDLNAREDSTYFQDYVRTRGLQCDRGVALACAATVRARRALSSYMRAAIARSHAIGTSER